MPPVQSSPDATPTARSIPSNAPTFPFELVRSGLEAVDLAIRSQASAFDPAVEGYVSYVCQASGKRIRPALALLAGGATGGTHEGHTRLSVILEMIHIASLVHDDIMDESQKRHNIATIHRYLQDKSEKNTIRIAE